MNLHFKKDEINAQLTQKRLPQLNFINGEKMYKNMSLLEYHEYMIISVEKIVNLLTSNSNTIINHDIHLKSQNLCYIVGQVSLSYREATLL